MQSETKRLESDKHQNFFFPHSVQDVTELAGEMEPPDLFLLRTGAMRRIRNTLVEVLINDEQKKLYFCLSLFHGLQGPEKKGSYRSNQSYMSVLCR